MTTLTNTITQELLDAVDNPAELDAVLKKHSHSKGPLYHAVAQATTRLQQQLRDDSTEISQIRAKGKELRDQAHTLENHCRELEVKGQSLEEKTRQAEASLVKVNELLDQVKALRGLGFGPDELSRLHDLLAGIATSQGTKPENAVGAFFRHVSQYESIVSLEMGKKQAEIARDKAKAEAERWQAEAKAAEAKAKARKTTIDFADKLLAQSVKEGDIPHWTLILSKGGVNPECLVLALEQFSSLENLCKDRQEQVKKLETQVKELTSQLEALNEERQQVSAAIGAIRETALAEIERTAQETLQDLNSLQGYIPRRLRRNGSRACPGVHTIDCSHEQGIRIYPTSEPGSDVG